MSDGVADRDDAVSGSENTGWLQKTRTFLQSPWVIGLMVIGLASALLMVAPPSEWQRAWSKAEPSWLLSAVLLVLPHEILKVLRIEQLIPCVKPRRLLHAKIVYGMACVAQLPGGTLGGDFYRVMRLEECGAEPEDATAATFLMRLIAFTTTATIAGIAGAILLDSVLPLLGPVIAAIVLLILATSQNPPGFMNAMIARADDTGSGRWGRLISLTARLLRHVFRAGANLSRKQIIAVLGFTLGLYAVRATIVWFCLLAAGIEVNWLVALATLSVGNLASAIPSPAGNVGLREGGMIGVLASLGTPVALATIGALLFRAVMIVGAGLGLLLSSVTYRLWGQTVDAPIAD